MRATIKYFAPFYLRCKSYQKIRSFSTKWAYECSSYITDSKEEKALIERSLRRGCTSILTKTSRDAIQLYDHLADLSAADDVALDKVFLGHTIISQQASIRRKPQEVVDEVIQINNILPKSSRLQFITLRGCFHDVNYIEEVFDLLNASGGKLESCHLGIDLDTKALMSLETNSMEETLQRMNTIYKSGGVLTVATNCFTYDRIKPIVRFAKDKLKLQVIATEIMRAHPSRPGLLAANYDFRLPHIPQQANAPRKEKGSSIEDRLQDALEATQDFKMAMDRCLQVEKKYLEKYYTLADKSDFPPITSICLANVIGKTLNQFIYPEDWMHVFTEQIEPNFEKADNALKTSRIQDFKEWIAMYRPMARYLLGSFRHLLQAKNLHLSQEVFDVIVGETGAPTVGRDDLGILFPLYLSLVVAQIEENKNLFDYISLAQTQVDQNMWEILERDYSPIASASSAKVLHRIRNILDVHNEPHQ